jgi:hypothetical protein
LPHTVRQGCLGPEVEARSYSKIFYSLLLDTVLGSPVGQNRGVNLMRAFRIFRRGAVEAPRGARAQQLHFTPMLRLGWPATFADPYAPPLATQPEGEVVLEWPEPLRKRSVREPTKEQGNPPTERSAHSERATASVSLMITQEQKSALRERGYDDEKGMGSRAR